MLRFMGNCARFLALIVAANTVSIVWGGDEMAIDHVWRSKAQLGIKEMLKKYASLANRLEEINETRYTAASGATGKMPFEPHFRHTCAVREGNNTLIQTTHTFDDAQKKPKISLQCDNDDYHFTLGKPNPIAPYVVVAEASGKRKLPLSQQGGHSLGATMFDLLFGALAALENKSESKLVCLKFDNTKRLVKVGIRLDGGLEELFLDPSNDWRVVERRIETPSFIGTDLFTYGETIKDLTFPIESKSHSKYKVKDAPPDLEITTKVISIKLTKRTSRDFRMTAFGLPEPPGMPAVPNAAPQWYIWISGFAIACLLIGAIFWRINRKAKSGAE